MIDLILMRSVMIIVAVVMVTTGCRIELLWLCPFDTVPLRYPGMVPLPQLGDRYHRYHIIPQLLMTVSVA